MERRYKIKEVASLFEIPVSTLHYWESIGLFEVVRNKENRYREYSISDILSIWEIMLYRDLDLPIQEIKRILEQDVEVLDTVYEASEQDIDHQISLLKAKKKKIQMQRALIKQLEQVKANEFTVSEPDLDICKVDQFTMESMRISLANPYQCTMYITEEDPKEYRRGIVVSPKKGEQVLWRKRGDTTYVEFLFVMTMNKPEENNLKEIREKLAQKGYQTGEIIARYLLTATEGECRKEYFRAWIKVSL